MYYTLSSYLTNYLPTLNYYNSILLDHCFIYVYTWVFILYFYNIIIYMVIFINYL